MVMKEVEEEVPLDVGVLVRPLVEMIAKPMPYGNQLHVVVAHAKELVIQGVQHRAIHLQQVQALQMVVPVVQRNVTMVVLHVQVHVLVVVEEAVVLLLAKVDAKQVVLPHVV